MQLIVTYVEMQDALIDYGCRWKVVGFVLSYKQLITSQEWIRMLSRT